MDTVTVTGMDMAGSNVIVAGSRALWHIRTSAVTAVLMSLWGVAFGQESDGGDSGPSSSSTANTTTGASAAARIFGASALSGIAPRQAWTITPSISVRETYTDNALPGQRNTKSDFITEIAPGIHIQGETARLKVFADYRLSEIMYASGSRGDRTLNSLNSFGTFEAVDNLLYVDFGGLVSQQDISAFATQTSSNVLSNSNRVEATNFRASPYLKGRIGTFANYELRYNYSSSDYQGSSFPGNDSSEWSGMVRGDTPFTRLGWMINASDRTIEYQGGRKSNSDSTRLMLTYQVDPQVKVSVTAGSESNDYSSLNAKRYSTSGFGADWSFDERTTLSVFRESRFFGYGHTINFLHRTPLSAIQYVDTKNVSVLPNSQTTVGLGTWYDLLYAATASDPLFVGASPQQRSAAVLALMNMLNLPQNAQVTGGFLSQQASVARQRTLSYAILGIRNSVTFMVSRSERDRLGAAITAGAGGGFFNYILRRAARFFGQLDASY